MDEERDIVTTIFRLAIFALLMSPMYLLYVYLPARLRPFIIIVMGVWIYFVIGAYTESEWFQGPAVTSSIASNVTSVI